MPLQSLAGNGDDPFDPSPQGWCLRHRGQARPITWRMVGHGGDQARLVITGDAPFDEGRIGPIQVRNAKEEHRTRVLELRRFRCAQHQPDPVPIAEGEVRQTMAALPVSQRTPGP